MSLNDNNDLQTYSDFQKLRGISKSFQQLTYYLKEIENRKDPKLLTSEEVLWFIKTYIAIKFDLEEFVKRLNEFYLKYGDKK